MEGKSVALKQARLWLGMVYGFGALGLLLPITRPIFLALTPVTLLLGAAALLWFEETYTRKFLATLILCWLAGFGIEVLGVKTGLVFGAYAYGDVLGPKLFGVPLIIGLNWVILLYCIHQFTQGLQLNRLLKPLLGAFLLVATDVLIEPVAVALGFWNWEATATNALFVAPFQNYLAWWLFSVLILSFFTAMNYRWNNLLAIRYWMYQCGFFALVGIGLAIKA